MFRSFLYSSNFFFKRNIIYRDKLQFCFTLLFIKSNCIFIFNKFFSKFFYNRKIFYKNFFFKFIYLFFFFKFLFFYYFFLLDFFIVFFKFFKIKFGFLFLFYYFSKNIFFEKYAFLFSLSKFFFIFGQNNLKIKTKLSGNLNLFFKLGLLKSFNENFFYSTFKKSKPLLLRNKVFNFLKTSDNWFFKFFFFVNKKTLKMDNFILFKNSLFFFFKIFFNRKLFSRSIFWYIWKNSQLFRYFYFFLRTTTFIFRIKMLFFLKGLTSIFSFSFFERRDFSFFYFLWCFFIFKFRNLFFKFKNRLACYFKNSYFFRQNFDFFDFDFYNRLFFDFDFSTPNSALILSFGKRYFFNKFFLAHITLNTFIFLKKYGFLLPFGFVGFLRKMMDLSFNLWSSESSFLFDGDFDRLFLKKTNEDLKTLHSVNSLKLRPFIFEWKKLFRRFFRMSRRLRSIKRGFFKFAFKTRFANYMSEFFYKKIYIYKYKLFLYFKSRLSEKFKFFFKFIKLIYNPFVYNLKLALVNKPNFYNNSNFSFDNMEIFWYKILYSFYFKSIFSLSNFSKRFGFLFKINNLFNFQISKFQHLFFKNQLLFYNNFLRDNFFFSLLGNFFKQLSFLVIPSTRLKLRKKQVYVFSSFVFFDLDVFIRLLNRFKFEQFDVFWVKAIPFLHLDSSLILEKNNRIFLLYLKLRQFLLQYWRLKFKFFLTRYVWKTNRKIFVFLFYLSEFIAKIYVKKSSTNYIVTLTDLFGKVLYTCTSFSSLVQKREDKRRRLSFFALEDMIDKFIPYIFLYDITMLILVSRIRTKMVYNTFFTKINTFGLKWYGSIREFLNPHNGVRGRKIRRR